MQGGKLVRFICLITRGVNKRTGFAITSPHTFILFEMFKFTHHNSEQGNTKSYCSWSYHGNLSTQTILLLTISKETGLL